MRPQLAADCRPCVAHVRAALSQLRHSLYDVALSVSIINPSRFSFITRFKRPRNFLLVRILCFFTFARSVVQYSFLYLLKFPFYLLVFSKISSRPYSKSLHAGLFFFFLHLHIASTGYITRVYLSIDTENRRRMHFCMMKRNVDIRSRGHPRRSWKPAIAKLWLIDSSPPSLDFFLRFNLARCVNIDQAGGENSL